MVHTKRDACLSKLVNSDVSGMEMQSLVLNSCQHDQVHEIGEDFDQDGRMLRRIVLRTVFLFAVTIR